MQNMPYPAVQLLSKIVDLRRDKTLNLRGNAEPMEILMTLIRRRDELENIVVGQAAKLAELREKLAGATTGTNSPANHPELTIDVPQTITTANQFKRAQEILEASQRKAAKKMNLTP